MTLEIATLVITAIQELMSLLGSSNQTVQLIDTIIGMLQKILPLLADIVPTVYQSVKNIIIELKADPATTQAQWAVLDAIDTQLDAANDAAIAAVDPDAPTA